MHAYKWMLLFPGLLSGASPDDCTTPLRVACMTVESLDEQWSLLHGGLNFQHGNTRQIIAYSANGSVAHQVTFENIPLIGNTETIGRDEQLYLGPSDRVVRIFHKDRTFSSREPIIWHDRPYRRAKNGDQTCASGILHSGTDFRMTGPDTLLSIKVFRWYRPLEYGGYEEQFLAPSLDCMILRGTRVYKNLLHIPTFTSHFEIRSIRFGEPDPSRFRIPDAYREVPDPSAERLRRYVEANQRRRSHR